MRCANGRVERVLERDEEGSMEEREEGENGKNRDWSSWDGRQARLRNEYCFNH